MRTRTQIFKANHHPV